jgi:hypothetical protein
MFVISLECKMTKKTTGNYTLRTTLTSLSYFIVTACETKCDHTEGTKKYEQ